MFWSLRKIWNENSENMNIDANEIAMHLTEVWSLFIYLFLFIYFTVYVKIIKIKKAW